MEEKNESATGGLLTSIINSLQDSVVSIDLQGKITSWNLGAQNLYGYTAAEALGQSVFILTLPEEMKNLLKNIEEIKDGQRVELYDCLRLHKSGENIDMEISLSPVKDAAGKVVGVSTIARNVTQLRQLQASVAESSNRFKTIANVVPQIIWENDSSGKATYFNQRFLDYSGRSFEDLTGPGWQLIAHPNAHVAVQAWMNALTKKDIFESEALLRRYDGLYQWHLLRNVPLKDENAEVIGWFGSATNIDDVKSIQLELKKTTERLKTTLETAVDFAIITMDNKGYIIDWNSGAERMFGYTPSDAIGQYADLIFTPEDRYGDMATIELTKAKKTGRAIDERWHLRKDGTRFFMSGVMAPMSGDVYEGFVKIARNITDRKLAEEALFLSEQRTSLAVQTAQMGEWEWDISSRTVQRSAQTCLLLGLPAVADNVSAGGLHHFIHEEDLPSVRAQLDIAMKGLNIFQCECRIKKADNTEIRWVNLYGRVVAHVDERPSKMIGVLYDITERKMLEKQKDDFINIASHELKTPLTSVKAYTELLEDTLAEKQVQPITTVLVQKLKRQVDRIIQLVYRLLDSKNITEGHMTLVPEVFDMNEVIAEQIDELQLIAGLRKLEWESKNIPLVHADRNRIRQVITNFISNAIKYSSDGTQIDISCKDDLDGIMVTVMDTGMGIPVAEQGKIFNRYFRSSDPTIKHHPGLGLGLYICAEIIKQHRGSIGVISDPGKGSVFYFKLPYS